MMEILEVIEEEENLLQYQRMLLMQTNAQAVVSILTILTMIFEIGIYLIESESNFKIHELIRYLQRYRLVLYKIILFTVNKLICYILKLHALLMR